MKFSTEQLRKSMLLYAVTDRMWLTPNQSLCDVCEEILKGGATFVQIREKSLGPETFETEAKKLKTVCARYQVPYVINDSVEIALKVDADGVHVGQSDIQGRDIRKLIGADKILGISANTVEQAVAAQQAGADYIGVGAVFGTSTKKNARPLSLQILREICNSVTIPVVAIGGINADNILQLSGSGVDGAAVVSALFAAPNPCFAAQTMRTLASKMVSAHE